MASPVPAEVDRLHPADEELLEGLETALRGPQGADRPLDAAAFAGCLGLRSTALAGRVMCALAGAGETVASADALLAGVKRLFYGCASDRRHFAFRIHDFDGDGTLDRAELRRMIALGFAEDDVNLRQGDADRLAGVLLRCADRSHDGRLSFDEFEAAIDRFPELADAIAKSGARWVVANEHAAARLERRQPLSRRLKRALENRGPALAMLVLWAVANALFFERARRAHAADNGFIQLARGFGACLNFNGALILLPMMRGVLTAVRKTALRAILPVDDAVAVHEVAGHAMFAFALAHVAAHLANYARMPGASVLERIATTPAARTGVAWLVVFAIMWFFARASARARRRFEVFHATHALYGVWFLAGVLHGPVFWKWIAIPFGVFALERLVRLLRRSRRTEILRTRVLRSGVTRLDLRKPEGFVHQAGDFVFLRVPQVAAHEWHPFTLSSAPERDTLSVHVRALGDWTAALRRLAETRRLGLSSEPLVAFVDGPYGAPCTEVFRSRRAVLIAGGIGVTPFASVLESILLRSRADTTALQRVDFVWLNRDQYSFEWFADLLASADHLDERRMLRVHVWMTGGRSDASSVAFDLARHASLLAGDPDVVTGLHIETHMGSPDWPALLGSIAGEARGEAEGEAVDVYFCGPPGLAAKIAPVCADAGMSFRQERF